MWFHVSLSFNLGSIHQKMVKQVINLSIHSHNKFTTYTYITVLLSSFYAFSHTDVDVVTALSKSLQLKYYGSARVTGISPSSMSQERLCCVMYINCNILITKRKLHGLSPRANYTDRATASVV
jgi:hypothetical protein